MARTLFFVLIQLFNSFFSEMNAAEKAEWTFLVYMAGDNDLEPEAFDDIREMEKVGSNSEMKVVVQIDSSTRPGVQRLLVEKAERSYANDAMSFQSPILVDMGEQDMSDPAVLKDFVKYGINHFPAEHYVLILWGHGSGWNKEESTLFRGIAFDDSSSGYLSNETLRSALRELKKENRFYSDVVIFDSCLMGMIETTRALKGLTDIVVGSEELVPDDGLPYDDFLSDLRGLPELDSKAIARSAVNTYVTSYSYGSQGNQAVTLSAVETAAIDRLQSLLDKWTWKLEQNPLLSRSEILDEIQNTLEFSDSSGRDLHDYVKRVLARYLTKVSLASQGEDTFVKTSNDLMALIKEAVIALGINGSRYENSSGLAIYIPYSRYGWSTWSFYYSPERDDYKLTQWALSSRWTRHLDFLFPSEY